MSTSLYWRLPERGSYLGKDLKYCIAQRYWGHDGTLGGEAKTFTVGDIPYLQGIVDAGGVVNSDASKEAQVLINLIEKHGEVEVWLEG